MKYVGRRFCGGMWIAWIATFVGQDWTRPEDRPPRPGLKRRGVPEPAPRPHHPAGLVRPAPGGCDDRRVEHAQAKGGPMPDINRCQALAEAKVPREGQGNLW